MKSPAETLLAVQLELAASEEGFRSIGIERELEYLEIAKGRLMATPMGFSWGEVSA
jgi:hypothetical protein